MPRVSLNHTAGEIRRHGGGTLCAAAMLLSCVPALPWSPGVLNPFEDLPAVVMDGRPHLLDYDVAPLGPLERGRVVRIEAAGTGIDAVLVLVASPDDPNVALLAGGGPGNTAFPYRVQASGRYFVHVLFGPAVPAADRRASLAVAAGDPDYRPPAGQVVRVVFEDGFLTNPGLVDPQSFTDEERQLLADVSGQVREGVLERLRAVLADFPIELRDDSDPVPTGPYSVLHFSPERKLAPPGETFDVTTVPLLLEQHPECRDAVVFGEVLPSGSYIDPGNRRDADEAVVYVGSFQGRGAACRSAAVNSVNHIVLGLAHTAAHEIGHLVGLFHVPLTDIMNRSPTLAFQRELAFGPGQILVEAAGETRILTGIVQDPAVYFRLAFDQPD